jgi:hypothetical protein
VDDFSIRPARGMTPDDVLDTGKYADGLGLGRQLQPLVERAAFVGLKVTPSDLPNLGRINQLADGLAQSGKHGRF